MEPRILGENTAGLHNIDLEKSIERVDQSKMYKDCSTIIICPTRGTFPTRVVQSWMKLMKPMNQLVAGPIFAESMRVDDAYNSLIKYILDNDYLKNFKYILTIEEDNLPPADGLLKLYEHMDEYDIIGGLYWSKSENGFPMMFGDPEKDPMDSLPQKPEIGKVIHVNALGMGFNLFKLDIFKKMQEPWFKTVEGTSTDGNIQVTQDIYFYRNANKEGFKCACDCRILVGHLDSRKDIIW